MSCESEHLELIAQTGSQETQESAGATARTDEACSVEQGLKQTALCVHACVRRAVFQKRGTMQPVGQVSYSQVLHLPTG